MAPPSPMKTSSSAIFLSLLAACSTTQPGIKDPEGYRSEVRARDTRNQEIKKDARSVPRIMQGFDKAFDKYLQARAASPDPRAIVLRETLDRSLRNDVRKDFDLLLAKADDPKEPADRGIALCVLGFADATEERFVPREGEQGAVTKKQTRVSTPESEKYSQLALNSLITGLNDPHPEIVEKALLGIGILAHENTPIEEVGSKLENTKNPLAVRKNAAWALAVMQDRLTPATRARLQPIYQRMLMQPLGEVEPTIATMLLRGLGMFRNKLDAKTIEPYCKHPDALVRIRAAIALGMTMNESSAPVLIDLIRETETNLNVRLAASKSLKALAGGISRGYDVKEWEKLFDRK